MEKKACEFLLLFKKKNIYPEKVRKHGYCSNSINRAFDSWLSLLLLLLIVNIVMFFYSCTQREWL